MSTNIHTRNLQMFDAVGMQQWKTKQSSGIGLWGWL